MYRQTRNIVVTVAVTAAGTSWSATNDGAPTVLDPIVFTASPVEQTGAGFVDGYRATTVDGATRTRTPIEAIPQSVSVIPRRVIDDQQAPSVSHALRNASGVIANNPLSTPAFDTTRVRGFRAEQLLDGFSQYYNPGDRESTVGIERIEVLKGANGILYGGGSGTPVGGLVNIVSKRPEQRRFGEFGISLGGEDLVRPFFDVNQPLSDNVVVRLNGEYTSSGSHVDVVETERYTINPSILFTDNDSTRLTLLGKVSHWSQPEYQGLPATGTLVGDFRIDQDLFIGPGDMPDSSSDYRGLTAILEHSFNDTWSIEVRARIAQSEFDEKAQSIVGADGFTADLPFIAPSIWALVDAHLFQEQRERSALFNAVAEFGTTGFEHTLLLGADYARLEDEGFIDSNFGAGGSGFVDLVAPVFPAYATPGPGLVNQTVDNEIYGVYAQLQSTVSNRLHLLAGVRAATVKVDFANLAFGVTDSTDGTRLLPRLGAAFELVDGVTLFGAYTEGLRGQPFLNFVGPPEPEESSQVEGGIKLNLANGLSGQLAVYRIERTNVAVTDNTDPLFRSVAEGEQRSRGFEADLVWQAGARWRLLASYAYTDADFGNALFGVPAGNSLPLVPRHSGRAWVHYRINDAWSAGLGMHAQSGSYLSDNNVFKTDGYHTVDGAIAYQRDNFRLEASVRNLTDQDYFEAYNYFGGRVAPAAGPQVLVTASIRY